MVQCGKLEIIMGGIRWTSEGKLSKTRRRSEE